jgi:hypothetical protein
MITSLFLMCGARVLRGHAALLAALVLASGVATAQVQSTVVAPDEGPPRLDGLKTGAYGLTTGPGGGLDFQVKHNGNVRPPGPLPPDAPPPSQDPRDFEGSWLGDQYLDAFEIKSDAYGNYVPFNEAGRRVMDMRLLANDNHRPYITPSIVCRSSGAPRDLIRVRFRIFQSKDKIDVLSNANRTWWQIALNPAIALPAGTRSYTGRSVGHWDGDTLVIETTGFRHRLYLSFRGTPLSPNGKLTDRIRKVHEDRSFLEIVTTVDDPTFYRRPWSYVRTYAWRPDMAVLDEYNCEEQVGDKSNDPTAGFQPEPNDSY